MKVGGLADALASSGEVHGVLGIIVDLDCLGQCLGVPAITLSRHVAAFRTGKQRREGFRVQLAQQKKRHKTGAENQTLCAGTQD